MGRTEPTVVIPPQAFRRDARSKLAKATLNKTIPDLLKSSARARRGVDAAELIVDPPPSGSPTAPLSTVESKPRGKSNARGRNSGKSDNGSKKNETVQRTEAGPKSPQEPLRIRLQVTDTLNAARELHQSQQQRRRQQKQNSRSNSKSAPGIGVLNMASPLRPGGGFLQGATSQEEFLCMRTTLYPSLREGFYRLPELGAVYTPDVLVFRTGDADVKELPKADQFFVDMVSAGMVRSPDTEFVAVEDAEVDGQEEQEAREKKVYTNEKDRELVRMKMEVVMRVFEQKGCKRVVLGAWGCGAYGNPVHEIASAWKRTLSEKSKKRRKKGGKLDDNAARSWPGIHEIVFAVTDCKMAEDFSQAWGNLELPIDDPPRDEVEVDDGEVDERAEELQARIRELETQIEQTRWPELQTRLQTVLDGLKQQIVPKVVLHEASDGTSESISGVDDEEDYALSGGESEEEEQNDRH